VRIPYPERIPIDRAVVFAVLLFLIQTLERTPLYFSAGCAAFILIATLAFNTAGGLTSTSGAYVFSYSILVVILGLGYKALLGEPADSNLSDPKSTIAVYVGGIASMFVAVLLSRRFARKKGLLQDMLQDEAMFRASVGCLVFGFGGPFLLGLLGERAAKLDSAFTQLNQLAPLGIIIGVMYEIRRSGGTRSLNAVLAAAMAFYFLGYGVLSFSKQGLLTPLLCWAIPVCALRFRLSPLQVASCLLGIFFVFYYLVPYSQYGRRFISTDGSSTNKMNTAVRLLSHPEDTRQHYEELQSEGYVGAHYYNTAQGFWDRLNFIAVDDSLINLTDQGTVFGFAPIFATFVNAVPHVFLPNKPTLNYGNVYAHELGALSDDDITTGISFSPTAESYHMGQWVGIFVAAPLIWLLVFIVMDSLVGDLRTTPWGLLVLLLVSHIAPEGGLSGAIYLVTFGAAIVIFCAFFATWVAPTFAIAVLGRDRGRVRRHIPLPPASAPQIPS
jgi:hypothetical protein